MQVSSVQNPPLMGFITNLNTQETNSSPGLPWVGFMTTLPTSFLSIFSVSPLRFTCASSTGRGMQLSTQPWWVLRSWRFRRLIWAITVMKTNETTYITHQPLCSQLWWTGKTMGTFLWPANWDLHHYHHPVAVIGFTYRTARFFKEASIDLLLSIFFYDIEYNQSSWMDAIFTFQKTMKQYFNNHCYCKYIV